MAVEPEGKQGRKGVNRLAEAAEGRGIAVVVCSTAVAGIEESAVRNVEDIWQGGWSYV